MGFYEKPKPTWYSTKLREVIEIHIACWGPSFWTLQWQLESRMEAAVHRSARHGMVVNHLWDAKVSNFMFGEYQGSLLQESVLSFPTHLWSLIFRAVISVAGWTKQPNWHPWFCKLPPLKNLTWQAGKFTHLLIGDNIFKKNIYIYTYT